MIDNDENTEKGNRGTGPLKAPFSYFGGKSAVASQVWERFGDVRAYVEPFAGSCAVLLARPRPFKGREIINDADCFIINFWRSVEYDPDATADAADWPVSECELHAWHLALVNKYALQLQRCYYDETFYLPEVAGRWAWGLSQWIGRGWCAAAEKVIAGHVAVDLGEKMPDMFRARGTAALAGHDIVTGEQQIGNIDHACGTVAIAQQGVISQMPKVSKGRVMPGAAGESAHNRMPSVDGERLLRSLGREKVSERIPSITRMGHGVQSSEHRGGIHAFFAALTDRLRGVAMPCGDWQRCVTPAVLWRDLKAKDVSAVFLDPPYSAEADRDKALYRKDCLRVAHDAREWAMANGDNPLLRIALCGYEGEHVMPDNWECFEWTAQGGYGNRSAKGQANKKRERIWFSPHCLRGKQGLLL